MKNKGFTLIELLAVIVILAIIALIAVPIVLGIINDAKKESNERSIELYGSAVEQAVARYQMNHSEDSNITYEKISSLISYNGNKVECETIQIKEDGTVYLADCKVDGVLVEGFTYGTKEVVCTYQDGTEYEGNVVGEIDQNDLVTCAGESFHVMSNDGETITMLAQYNLDLTTDIQSATPPQANISDYQFKGWWHDYCTILVSDEYLYDDIESDISLHVSAYETYLKNNGVDITSAKLISREQVNDLKTNKGNPNWLYTTRYWTGSGYCEVEPVDEFWSSVNVYDGLEIVAGNGREGIRPVVTISVNEF